MSWVTASREAQLADRDPQHDAGHALIIVSRANQGAKGKVMSLFGIGLGILGIVLWIALLAANHGHVSYHVG